ncbi:MAG: hypothetical protein ACFB10_07695 [Salibacteraceae bacterium]
MRSLRMLLLFLGFLGCTEKSSVTVTPGPEGWQTIDNKLFSIQTPIGWKHQWEQGIDSYVGRLFAPKVDLSFDWSSMGYANPVMFTLKEYIYNKPAMWEPLWTPYPNKVVFYTDSSENLERVKAKIMKEKGITDVSLIQIEYTQNPEKEIRFENGAYIAQLIYNDTVVEYPIPIPEKIKNHIIEIDTLGGFRRKLIRPKPGLNGTTGVYFEDLNSDFNFNIYGEVTGAANQADAIKAFRSIQVHWGKG